MEGEGLYTLHPKAIARQFRFQQSPVNIHGYKCKDIELKKLSILVLKLY